MTYRVPATGPVLGKFKNTVATNSNVTAVTAEICPVLPDRKLLILTNIGNKDVWCNFDGPAEVDKGFLIAKNGGRVVFTALGISDKQINGITSSGTSTVSVFEGSN